MRPQVLLWSSADHWAFWWAERSRGFDRWCLGRERARRIEVKALDKIEKPLPQSNL